MRVDKSANGKEDGKKVIHKTPAEVKGNAEDRQLAHSDANYNALKVGPHKDNVGGGLCHIGAAFVHMDTNSRLYNGRGVVGAVAVKDDHGQFAAFVYYSKKVLNIRFLIGRTSAGPDIILGNSEPRSHRAHGTVIITGNQVDRNPTLEQVLNYRDRVWA